MQIEKAKSLLETKKTELSKRIEAISKDLQKAHSSDWAEQATERENDEVLQELANEAKVDLRLINAALQRIDEGDYGLCTACNKDINEKRLEAFPEADKCIECAV
jgi:RNA polymerase-binding protein DksA